MLHLGPATVRIGAIVQVVLAVGAVALLRQERSLLVVDHVAVGAPVWSGLQLGIVLVLGRILAFEILVHGGRLRHVSVRVCVTCRTNKLTPPS